MATFVYYVGGGGSKPCSEDLLGGSEAGGCGGEVWGWDGQVWGCCG